MSKFEETIANLSEPFQKILQSMILRNHDEMDIKVSARSIKNFEYSGFDREVVINSLVFHAVSNNITPKTFRKHVGDLLILFVQRGPNIDGIITGSKPKSQKLITHLKKVYKLKSNAFEWKKTNADDRALTLSQVAAALPVTCLQIATSIVNSGGKLPGTSGADLKLAKHLRTPAVVGLYNHLRNPKKQEILGWYIDHHNTINSKKIRETDDKPLTQETGVAAIEQWAAITQYCTTDLREAVKHGLVMKEDLTETATALHDGLDVEEVLDKEPESDDDDN